MFPFYFIGALTGYYDCGQEPLHVNQHQGPPPPYNQPSTAWPIPNIDTSCSPYNNSLPNSSGKEQQKSLQ